MRKLHQPVWNESFYDSADDDFGHRASPSPWDRDFDDGGFGWHGSAWRGNDFGRGTYPAAARAALRVTRP